MNLSSDSLQLAAMAALFVRVAFPPRATRRTRHPVAAVIIFRSYATVVAIVLCLGLTAGALREASAPMLQAMARVLLIGYVCAELGLAFEFRGGRAATGERA